MAGGCRREALALQSKFTVGPTSRRNLYPNWFHECGCHDIGAQSRLPRENGKRDMNVAPLSAKDVVRSDRHAQIQITGLATVGAGLSLAGHANPRSILNPGRDSYFDRIGL